MKARFFMTMSILVIVLSVLWLIFYFEKGVELAIVIISLVFAGFTMFLIYLFEKTNKGK